MDVQLAATGLEIHVAKRLKAVHFKLGELDENTTIACKTLQIRMALPIQIGTHFLDLEIRHVADAPAQCTLVRARPAKLEALHQPPVRQQLPRRTNDLAETHIAGKHADDMGASRDPDQGLVLLRLDLATGMNLEKLRMQRALEKTERQLVYGNVGLWRFHEDEILKNATLHFGVL